MQKYIRTTCAAVGFVGVLGGVTIPAWSQDKPANNMEIVHEKLKADKKLIVGKYMDLTESEAKNFWPVYDEYQKDLQKIHERLGSLLRSYAAEYRSQSLTDEKAKKLLDEWIALDISPFQRYVGDLDHLLRLCRTPYTCVGGWMHDPRPRLLISGWRVVHRSGAEAVALAEVKRTELGLADAGCVLEHGLEHGLQLARGTADDFQHIGGRGLLLQRFAQIVGA